jgi:hypothetical protein
MRETTVSVVVLTMATLQLALANTSPALGSTATNSAESFGGTKDWPSGMLATTVLLDVATTLRFAEYGLLRLSVSM